MKLLFIITMLSVFFLPLGNLYAQAIGHSETGHKKNPENLTDEEKIVSESYIHSGFSQRVFDENCNKDEQTRKACQGRKAESKFLGLDSSMISAVTKAYTMVIGAGGLGGSFKRDQASQDKLLNKGKDTKKADTTKKAPPKNKTTAAGDNGTDNKIANSKDEKKLSKEEKEVKDYCKYIAVGTETVAMFSQQASQQNLSVPTGQATAQRNTLLRAARSHKDRATNSNIQTVGWGATAACYTGMLVGPAALDWNLGLKLGSSALLTVFYKKQTDAHKDYESKVKNIANQLPGRGNCNPVTDVDCYCTQPETQNDQKYCAKHLHKRALAASSARITCLDNKLKADPSCNCISNNNCYDKELTSNIEGLNFGSSFADGFKPFASATRGELIGGNVKGATNKQFAIAQRALKKAEATIPSIDKSLLSKAQRKEINALRSLGVPVKLASKIASIKLSPAAKKNLARFRGAARSSGSNYNYSNSRKSGSKVLTFEGGDGLNKKASRGSNSYNINKYLRKKKRGSSKSSGKVISFSEQAQKQAQITKRPGVNIFQIISRRYKVSAPRRLELEE